MEPTGSHGARGEISQAASLMYALFRAVFAHAICGNYTTAKALCDEFVDLSDEKGASFWKALAMSDRGCLLALTGDAAAAVHMISSALSAYHSTGATVFTPWYLSTLAGAHAKLGQFDHAWRCIDEAMTAVEATKETWCDAELNCTAGKIALMVPDPDATKAEAYFQRALSVARAQQAKSWELRASMSLSRLWRSQGKVQQARELLAPVYGWFTEGFDTAISRRQRRCWTSWRRNGLLTSPNTTLSAWDCDRLRCPSVYGARDEETLQSRRRTD
jgi:ATP/maltotriose-dependent transcriptional regulator MalT